MVPGETFFHPVFQDNFEKRGYWLYWPDRHQGAKSMPLVLALHGGGRDGESMARLCGLNEKADEAGFLVLYRIILKQIIQPHSESNIAILLV